MGAQPQVTSIESFAALLFAPVAATLIFGDSPSVKRQRTASWTSEELGGGIPEAIQEIDGSVTPALLSANGDPDLMSTGVAKLAQAELPPAERVARALSETAGENPP